MKLLGKRLMIKLVDPEEKTKAGIILTEKRQPNMGTIAHLGDEISHKSLEIGSTVIFDMSAGSRYSINGETFICLNQEDVVVVL